MLRSHRNHNKITTMPTNNPDNNSKQGTSVTRLLIGVVIVSFVLWMLPIFLGNHIHERPNPEAIFRVFIIVSGIIVGLGLLADLFLNPNDRQIISEKRSGHGHRFEIQPAGEGLRARICPRETSSNPCRYV